MSTPQPGQEWEEEMVPPPCGWGQGRSPLCSAQGRGPTRPLHRTGELGDCAGSLGPSPHMSQGGRTLFREA